MPRWEERQIGGPQEQVFEKWMDGHIGEQLWYLAERAVATDNIVGIGNDIAGVLAQLTAQLARLDAQEEQRG